VSERTAPLALQVQDLPTGTDRVLVVAALVSERSPNATFSPVEINKAFDAFRLPPPSNTSQSLAQLRSRGFAVKRLQGRWSLTPRGEAQVTTLLGELPEASAPAMGLAGASAEFGEGKHTVIPPFFAPSRWSHEISRFLDRHPFDENVFCMTRFPTADALDPSLSWRTASRRG
jgi:hypothetical protein